MAGPPILRAAAHLLQQRPAGGDDDCIAYLGGKGKKQGLMASLASKSKKFEGELGVGEPLPGPSPASEFNLI